MQWKKLGKIFCASGESDYMQSGGRAPIALHKHDDVFKIFFGSYDALGRGRIFSLDLNITAPEKVENITTQPLIDLGEAGFYDDNGIIPASLISFDNTLYLYTIGFSVKNKLMFDSASGLAISHDSGVTFTKEKGTVIDRSFSDPCFAVCPYVIKEDAQWHMWYVSCEHWEKDGEAMKHFYNIKYKTSEDGIYWSQKSITCIDFANEHEYAIARPSVIRTQEGLYRMWYCFRAQPHADTYRIGYAESLDGKAWERKDHLAGIDVSEDGWDSEMICYPYVFTHNNKYYMLYNGNGYGRTGFGLAILEEE